MKSRNELEDVLKKEFPYRVPDGYFSTLEEELVKKIRAKDRAQRGTLLTKLKPAFALVASFAIIVGIGYGVLTATKGLSNRTTPQGSNGMAGMESFIEGSLLTESDSLATTGNTLEEELIDNYLLSEITLVTLLTYE